MKKISADLIVDQIKRRFESDAQETTAVIESLAERRGLEQYRQFLQDCLGVFEILETQPWNAMYINLIQSAIDEKQRQKEAG